MRLNKYIIIVFLLLFSLCMYGWIYYYHETQRLQERINFIHSAPPYNYEKWYHLTIGIFLEALKQQHINLDSAEKMFRFYETEQLIEIKSVKSDMAWRAFDSKRIDMCYDMSYDKVFTFSPEPIFLLFKDSVLIDYRYYTDREFLHKYLKDEWEPDDRIYYENR